MYRHCKRRCNLGIHEKQTQRASYEAFLTSFKKLPNQLTEFTLATWHGLVDYVTVYADGRLTFTFKNGSSFEG